MLGTQFNYNDVFLRDLTVAVLAKMEDQIKWTNVFESGPVDVNCKVYYSLTGSEDYLLDSFVDDIVSNNRKVELNTDSYPRGHMTLSGWRIKGEEFSNPNVWLRSVVENQDEIRNVLAKMRSLPISATFDLTILLNSEIDTFKASESIMNTMWMYKYIHFEHNFMNIDAEIIVPDDQQVEITREQNLGSDGHIKMTLSFEVHTYYPAYNENTIQKPNSVTWSHQINKLSSYKLDNNDDFSFNFDRTVNYFDDQLLKIFLNLSVPGDVKMKVYDNKANVLYSYDFEERQEAGDHVINLDISDKQKYITGEYFIKLIVNDDYKTLPLTIDSQ